MKRTTILLSLAFVLSAAAAPATEKKITRDQMVRNDIAEVAQIDEWIYNDLGKAQAEARRSGKPMMLVFRCIP